MKKLLALLLCAAMLVAVVPVALADDFQIVVDSISCDPDDQEYELAVYVENNPGFFAMQLEKVFPAELEYTGSESADPTGIQLTEGYNDETGAFGPNILVESLKMTTSRPKKPTDYKGDADIVYLYFVVPAGTAPGDYTVTFNVLSANNSALQTFDDLTVIAGTIHVNGDIDVSTYKPDETDPATWTAPTSAGKKFAGWYTDDTYSTSYTAASGVAEPKFVDAAVMTVRAQANNTDNAVRFLSTIDDSLDYQAVGFYVKAASWSAPVKKTLNSVYNSVKAAGVDYDPDEVSGSSDSKYITFCKLTGIPDTVTDEAVTVTPFWVTPDGTEVQGDAQVFYVSYGATVTAA